jgi:hypothetical protein
MRTILSPAATTRWVRLLYVICGLLVAIGIGYQLTTDAFEHAHHGFETWPGFYGVFGFAAFVFIVYGGILLRRLVRRDEDYYRPDDPERNK